MKKNLLRMIVLLSGISFLLFFTGFIMGANDVINPKGTQIKTLSVKENTDTSIQDGKLTIVGLGDSLTRGVGDAEGKGYIGRIHDQLKKMKQDVFVTNLAVSGAKTDDLLALLENKGVQYTLAKADLVLLTIGGNDLNPGWDKLGTIDLTKYQGDVKHFEENGKAILDSIRKINKTSPIYWVGLYNPFEDISELKGSDQNVLNWNAALFEMAADYPDVYIIPVFDLFQNQTKKLLYTDHFHPNQTGYQLIADRILQKLELQMGIQEKKGGTSNE